MFKCLKSGQIRLKHRVDQDWLTVVEKYMECYENQACNAPILQHFIGYLAAYTKHLEEDENGKFGEMVEKIPPPRKA